MDLTLGPFRLVSHLASGGMAAVWRAVHEPSGQPVAVKVMGGERARASRFVRAFNEEARLMAGLEHPGVVAVLDYGLIPEALGGRGTPPLVVGSPYLVMELAAHSSLDRVVPPLPWLAVRGVVASVLDALAHAHARGVLHLDIKPGNVLCRSPDLASGEVCLSDFGMARAFEDAPDSEWLRGGTPEFMPPEQVEARWRDQGPWTDVYAVGCMAWLLATGDYLFRVPGDPHATARMHLGSARPHLAPLPGYPEAFGPWLRTLVAHRPEDRPGSAAAAMRGLLSLGSVATTETGETPRTYSFTLAMTFDEVPPEGARPPEVAVPAPSTPAASPVEPTPSIEAVAPSPPLPDWRAPTPPRRPLRLLGAGLGLFALRRFPMVDRVGERETIWAALGEVVGTRRSAAVLLEGELGVGRTRLADAVADRVVELGVGSALRITHGRIPGPGDGLLAALSRHLRLTGLDAEGLAARLSSVLGQDAPAAEVARLFVGGAVSDPEGVAGDERDRRARVHDQLTALLAAVAGSGVVVVVVDEAEWAGDTLAVVRDVLRGLGRPVPALFLVCASAATTSDELEWLRSRAGVVRQPVGPLPIELVEELVADFLAFARDAAREVARRTAGNPLLALQLVRSWVDQGLLSLEADGFVPAPGADVGVGLAAIWQEALSRVAPVGDGAPGLRIALRIAAALGGAVRIDEWQAACAAVGVDAPDSLTEAMYRARLAEPAEAGWRFVHPAVQEVLEDELRERGEWASTHARLAGLLADVPGVDRVRVARHLVEAGSVEAATDILLEVIRGRLDAFAFREVLSAVELLRSGALVADSEDHAVVPHDDRRRGEAAVLEVRALIGSGKLKDADRAAVRAAELARSRRWPDVRARALRYRGMALEKQGNIQLAEAVFSQAELLSEQVDDEENLAACLEHRGTLLRQQGDTETSRALLTDALAIYRRLAQPRLIADCLKELGGTLLRCGEVEGAEAHLAEAITLYRQVGSAAGGAEALNNLAEIERTTGRLTEAEAHYREAFTTLERAGHQASPIPLLNLGQIQLARRDWEGAADTIRRALAACIASGRKGGELYARAFQLPCLAAAGEWSVVATELDTVDRLTDETGLLDPEIADALSLAAGLADDAAMDSPARRARALEGRHRGIPSHA